MGSCRAQSVYLTTFTGQTYSSKQLTSICAHSFARNWQLLFLNQQKGENDRRKYFMINLHERKLPTLVVVEPATSWSPVGRSSNWATEADSSGNWLFGSVVWALDLYPGRPDSNSMIGVKFLQLCFIPLLRLSSHKIWQPNKMATGHKTHKLGRQSSNDHNCPIWITSLSALWRNTI